MAMYSGRFILVGVFIILFLVCVSLVVFYINKQGSCQSSTFTCSSGDTCVPQKNVCNGKPDCPNGDDEDEVFCADVDPSPMIEAHLNKSFGMDEYMHSIEFDCDLKYYPDYCVCKFKTFLGCKNLSLTEVPKSIAKDVTRLILSNNSIHSLDVNSFENYNLELIHLEGNGLRYIPPNIFKGQVNLVKVFLNKNNLTVIEKGVFSNLPNLTWLFLDNNSIKKINLDDFENLESLTWLDLSNNKLTLENETFPNIANLKELFLRNNEITCISKDLLYNLESLHFLSLRGNKIVSIDEEAFIKLVNLIELDLYGNQIVTLQPMVFNKLKTVRKLYLGFNPFQYIAKEVFFNVESLRSLNMEGIEIYNIDIDMFQTLHNLESVYFKKYSYCSYAPNVPRCRPISDGISSTNQLLYKPILRYSTWAICLCTCVSNLMVLWGRFIFGDENKSLSLVIRNLAVSDFIMGLYLLTIAIHDVKFRDTYNTEAYQWIKSWTCTLTGMLGMISSEVSVLLLLFMSIDRFLLIAIPFGKYGSLSVKDTTLVLIVIWAFGISLAIIPTLEFYSSTRFYGVNGLCFPLFIDDPYYIGWEFSVIIFIGINATSLIIMAIVYAGMFVSIWKTRNATSVPIKDFEFAVRFFFIVVTDMICWLPIITMKILAYYGNEISADMYGWLIVFILPINSALNPLLYTFTTPRYRAHLYRIPINAIETGLNRTKHSPHGSADTGSMQLTQRNGQSFKMVTNKF